VPGLHLASGVLAGALFAAALVLVLAGRPTGGRWVVWVDRAILAGVPCAALAGLTGAALAVGGRGPGDPLHYLYALLALSAVPIGRAVGGRHGDTGLRVPLAIACLIGIGAIVRLYQTGP
jgi:hypothetical protein